MARRTIKKEPVTKTGMLDAQNGQASDSQQTDPVSSGATQTTIVDTDIVMHDDFTANHQPGFAANSVGQDGISNFNEGGHSHNAARSSSEATAIHEAHGGLELLGRGVKELVQAVQNLRHLGVEDLVIPLPKIVVVGDQSTGKSSLIEGIRQCPLEINLSESTTNIDPWTCHISLFKKYTYQGRAHAQKAFGRVNSGAKAEGATKARPLGPWMMQEPEDSHFATTHNKDELSNLLEWAQIATLNPGSAYEDYMPQSESFKGIRNNQVKFSPNVVRMDITGPQLPNLSFYDLPGVINVADVESEAYLVDLVKNLVKDYIKAENCINLLALPMTDDPSNSTASRIIREEKAEARTVGVLTKPDRVQEAESIEQWMHILDGKSFRLGQGYHVVLNNPDVNVDHKTARMQEQRFFDGEPWANTLKQHHEKFGTLKLQATLSHKLAAQIRASLPHFTEQVGRKIEEITNKLAKLPEPPAGNLPLKILERIMLFETEMQKHFDGGIISYTFQLEWHDEVEQFRKILMESKPLLIQRNSVLPTIEGSSYGTPTPARKPMTVAITIDSDDDDDPHGTPLPDRSTKKRPNGVTPMSTPSKKPRISDIPMYTPQKSPSKPSYSRTFGLDEISRYLKEAHIGLPGQIDPKATERMIHLSLSVWDEPLKDFIGSSITLCESLVSQQISAALSKWQQTRLYNQTVDICATFFDRVANKVRSVVADMYKRELRKPVMFNKEALTSANEKALFVLKARRRDFLAAKFIDEVESIDKTPTNRQSKNERMSKVTDAQLGPDPYSQEVLAMGCVRGYYECACSRFVDVICQAVLCELFDTCRNGLGNVIKEELHLKEIDGHERCAVLLAINPELEQQRHQLLKEKDTLEKAQERLHGLAGAAAHALGEVAL